METHSKRGRRDNDQSKTTEARSTRVQNKDLAVQKAEGVPCSRDGPLQEAGYLASSADEGALQDDLVVQKLRNTGSQTQYYDIGISKWWCLKVKEEIHEVSVTLLFDRNQQWKSVLV